MASGERESPYIPSVVTTMKVSEASRPFKEIKLSSSMSSCRWTPWNRGRETYHALGCFRALNRTQFVLVRAADAVYAFTAVMASASLDARCREVAVTHSPGFRDLRASTLPGGTWNLNVTYWRDDS